MTTSPGSGDDSRPAVAELERPLEHLEALALERVDVRGGDGAVGLDGDLDLDELAVGVGRCLKEVDGLAGERILDRVACADGSRLRGHVRASCGVRDGVPEP